MEAINKVAKNLASKFRFGYVEEEDLKQEIAIECLKALEKYNGQHALENFFWVHCRKRLCNFKRDNYERLDDKPCIGCPFYDKCQQQSESECTKYENKMNCKEYSHWFRRNERKKNLVNKPGECDFDTPQYTYELDDTSLDMEFIEDIIDAELPVQLREDYFKYRYNIRLHPLKSKIIVEEIRAICRKHGIIGEEDGS